MDELEFLLIEQVRDCQSDQPTTLANLHNNECGFEQAYQYATGIPYADKIKSDDELRNINSFEYLRQIAVNIPTSLSELPGFKEVVENCGKKKQYYSATPYGNYYTNFLLAFSQFIREHDVELFGKDVAAQDRKFDLAEIDALIHTVYFNHNLAIERAYAVIKDRIGGLQQTDNPTINAIVKDRLQSAAEVVDSVNAITPLKSASASQEVRQVIGSSFNPMLATNQPSQILFHYRRSSDPVQLRMCTQGMVDGYSVEINPLFRLWLSAEMRRSKSNDEVVQVYFNHLSRAKVGVARKRERHLTKALEKLAKESPQLVMINLPADSGFLSTALANEREKPADANYQTTFDRFLAIVNGSDEANEAKDFYISNAVKKQLYGDGDPYNINNERAIVSLLILKSFNVCGFNSEVNNKLSPADQQAVFFHLMKYELPNFILTKLKPRYFNFSCKDTIDRGAATSTYYHLIKSIQTPFALTLSEFERSVHGAATLVKGRGMNKQIHNLWNTLDCIIDAASVTHLEIPNWLPNWRDVNALPSSPHFYKNKLSEYLNTRLREGDYLSFFGRLSAMNKHLKIEVAGNLLAELSNHQYRSAAAIMNFVPNSPLEYKALHDGRLGKIISELTDRHLVAIKTDHSELTNKL